MKEFHIREFRYPEDYDAAIRLWESAGAGVHVGPSDSPNEIQRKLQRDPDLFLVAEDQSNIVGTVIGGFDGRRGMVYHLAVAPSFRRQGVASQLMAAVESRLKKKGCLKAYLLVRRGNSDGLAYYQATGWAIMDDFLFAKELS